MGLLEAIVGVIGGKARGWYWLRDLEGDFWRVLFGGGNVIEQSLSKNITK